jgi:membrane protein
VIIQATNFILGLAIVTVLFALMFKVLPDVEIKWKSVWIGAVVTALLFNVGKMLMSFYFDLSKPTSIFGAAGTVILLMMWINYSCQLVFFGAEFTKIFAYKKGHKIVPSKHAKWSKENSIEILNKKRYNQLLIAFQDYYKIDVGTDLVIRFYLILFVTN